MRPITESCSDWTMRSKSLAFSMATAAWSATTSSNNESSSVKNGPPFLLMTSSTPRSSSLLRMGAARMDLVVKPV